MTDQFTPPGWLPGPETWPYWLPTAQPNPFKVPPVPNDASDQIRAQWWRQATGADGDAATAQRDDFRDRTNPAWLRSAMPTAGGILGPFPQLNDSPTTPSGGGGILGSFGQPNNQWDQSSLALSNSGTSSPPNGGILAPLERLTSPSGQSVPAWLQSMMPFGANFGSSALPGSSQWGHLQAPANWPSSVPSPTGSDWLALSRKAVEPITSYPQTYSDMNREAREQIAHGLEQVRQAYQPGVHDPIGFLKGLGNVGLGTFGYVGSPINAALRTIAGKPIEGATSIPKEYTEFALSLGIPGLGLRSAAPARPATPSLRDLPGWIQDAPFARPLTPLEHVQRMRYNQLYNTLREIDPTNPQLSALDTSRWFPQSGDSYLLYHQIEKLKEQLRKQPSAFDVEVQPKIAALDDHHNFVTKWAPKFRRLGIEPNDYNSFLDAGRHRLLDYGPDPFTRQWDDFFVSDRPQTIEGAFEHLSKIMQQSPWWKVP
jgi:hypothetical protein